MSDFMQGNPDSAISVPFSDDESNKDDDATLLTEDDSPTATPEERITRKQKRTERVTRMLADGKQNAEENRKLKDEQAALRTELAQLRGFVAAQAPRSESRGDGKDPYEAALDAVYEKQSSAYAAAQAEIKSGAFTEARAKHYEKIAREVETEKSRIHTRRELDQTVPAMRQEQAQQVWVQKYPEVYNNPKAYQYAAATFDRRKAVGEAPTNAMVDDIMAETMRTFKIGPKASPSASEKSRMSGIHSSGSGGSSADTRGIVMTEQFKRMATAAHSDLPEAEAIKKWVNGTGKKLRERKVI